jgi:hypothetical protein
MDRSGQFGLDAALPVRRQPVCVLLKAAYRDRKLRQQRDFRSPQLGNAFTGMGVASSWARASRPQSEHGFNTAAILAFEVVDQIQAVFHLFQTRGLN